MMSTGMTQEVDRCRKAVELALENKTVSVISGGDPGVYAMAGLVFETARSRSEKKTARAVSFPRVEVIPGISALNAAASRLGAPLMHDFACISLSDRLTPWDMIEKRLDAAAGGGFRHRPVQSAQQGQGRAYQPGAGDHRKIPRSGQRWWAS